MRLVYVAGPYRAKTIESVQQQAKWRAMRLGESTMNTEPKETTVGASDLSDLLCTNDILALLDRIVPRIDAGGPNPIDEKLHHCEYTLYRERERIHAEFRGHFRGAKKMVHEHSFSPSLLDGGGTLVCACGAWK